MIRTSGKRLHPIVEASDNPGDAVEGKVFSITEAELKAADEYEVSDYKRVEVRLRRQYRLGIRSRLISQPVMPGLVPGIHVFASQLGKKT